MKFFRKIGFSNLVAIVFFIGIIYYFANNHNALKELTSVSFVAVLALIALKFTRLIASGFFTKYTLESFRKRISTRETIYISLLSSMGNFFGPVLGGAGVRAVYLKKKHNFKFSTFLSTLYGYYVISLFINSALGVLLTLYLISTQGRGPQSLFILVLFSSITTLCLLLLVIPTGQTNRFIQKRGFIPKKVKKILDNFFIGWEIIRKSKKLLLKLVGLNFIIISLFSAQTYLLYSLFAENFTIVNVILYTLIGTLMIFISFTPGAIGIKEGALLFFASVIALSPEQILQIAIIDRSSTFIVLTLMYALSFNKRINPEKLA